MIEALKISGVGVFVVFFVLVIISSIIAILNKFFSTEKKTISKNIEDNTKDSEIKEEDGISPEIIAVITAAINATYCTKKIKSIGVLHKESNYGVQGRINIMSSHKLK